MTHQVKPPFIRELLRRVTPHEIWACASSIKVVDSAVITSTLLVVHPDDADAVNKVLSDAGFKCQHVVVTVDDFEGVNTQLQSKRETFTPIPSAEEMSKILMSVRK